MKAPSWFIVCLALVTVAAPVAPALAGTIPADSVNNTEDKEGEPHLVRVTHRERGQICAYAVHLLHVHGFCQPPHDPTEQTNVSQRYCKLPVVGCEEEEDRAGFNLTRNVTGWRVELRWDAKEGTVHYFRVAGPDGQTRYVNGTESGEGVEQPIVIEDEGKHWQAMLDVFGPGRWQASFFPRVGAAMSWEMTFRRDCVVPHAPTAALVERACGLPANATWEDRGAWEPPTHDGPPVGTQGTRDDMEESPGNGWSNEPFPGFGPVVGFFQPWPPNAVNRWHVTDSNAHSGQKAWRVGVEDVQAHSMETWTRLVSPIIDARELEDPTLSFWVNGTAAEYDLLAPSARPVNSSIFQWKRVGSIWGSTDGWTKKTYPLEVFEGHRLRVGFWFRASYNCLAGTGVDPSLTLGLVSCGHESSAGYHVDDVVVS